MESTPSRFNDRSIAVKIAGRKRNKWPANGIPRSSKSAEADRKGSIYLHLVAMYNSFLVSGLASLMSSPRIRSDSPLPYISLKYQANAVVIPT